MLRRVLQELEANPGVLDRAALSQKLGIEPSALDGMIAFWVQKGRVRSTRAGPGAEVSCAGGCGACGGAQTCPFVMVGPPGWEVIPLAEKPT